MKIYRNAQRRIREYLSKNNPNIREYTEHLHKDFENQTLRYRTKLTRFFAERLRGSLTDLIITVNALILGGLAWTILSCFNTTIEVRIISTVLAAGIGLALMYIYHEILSDKLPPFSM